MHMRTPSSHPTIPPPGSVHAGPPPMPDWGLGQYERFAAELLPAAEHVVRLAGPRAGEEVLDVACGTGNGALIAARAGANVTGLDLSSRLIDVARARAAADGLEAAFVVGDAQALPFDEQTFDVVMSVFGVIFAPDARRTVSELLRVLGPRGRALVSAWVPGGALDAMVSVASRAVTATLGIEISRFAWHDEGAVAQLVAGLGAVARTHDGEIAFEADSPEAYLADQEQHHPMMIGARGLLTEAGRYDAVRDEMLDALRRGNEDEARFRTTGRYRVIELHRA